MCNGICYNQHTFKYIRTHQGIKTEMKTTRTSKTAKKNELDHSLARRLPNSMLHENLLHVLLFYKITQKIEPKYKRNIWH